MHCPPSNQDLPEPSSLFTLEGLDHTPNLFFQTLIDASPSLVYVRDYDGRYVWANQTFAQFFGVPIQALTQAIAVPVFADSALELPFLKEDQNVIDTEQESILPEELYLDITCKPHWLQWHRRPLNVMGTTHVMGIGIDITERKKSEDALWNIVQGVCSDVGEAFFQSLVQYLAKALDIDLALVGEVTEVSKPAVKTVAVCAEGQIIKNFNYVLAHTPNEQLLKKQMCVYPCTVQQNFPKDRFLRIMNAESYLGLPLLDSSGELLGVVAVIGRKAVPNIRLATEVLRIFAVRAAAELERRRSDAKLKQLNEELEQRVEQRTIELKRAIARLQQEITHRQQAEEDLRANDAALRRQLAIVEAAIDGIAIVEHDQYVYLNQAHAQLFGYDRPEHLIGKSWRDFYPGEEVRRFERDIWPHLIKHHHWRGEAIARRRDGTLFDEEVSLTRTDDGSLIRVCRDISDRKRTERDLHKANQQLQSWVDELEQRNQEMSLISEIGDFLQASLTVEDACKAVSTLVQALFPNCSGGLFINYTADDSVEAVATWGEAIASYALFTPRDCWGLRRGRLHWVDPSHQGLFCSHVDPAIQPAANFCVPMMAQGETLGLLYLETADPARLPESKRWLARAVAEQIALAIANLRLQETLQNQSIRDPLTGLYNRRHLERSLEQMIHRARRNQLSIGVVMMDIDHFKQFNDRFGHDAGDVVLQEVSRLLQAIVRSTDVVCRYGGEEITLILPDLSLEQATYRAEEIRNAIRSLKLWHRGQDLGRLTASLGVACFPAQGTTGYTVIQAADMALYQAKTNGRDRVVMASHLAQRLEQQNDYKPLSSD